MAGSDWLGLGSARLSLRLGLAVARLGSSGSGASDADRTDLGSLTKPTGVRSPGKRETAARLRVVEEFVTPVAPGDDGVDDEVRRDSDKTMVQERGRGAHCGGRNRRNKAAAGRGSGERISRHPGGFVEGDQSVFGEELEGYL